MWTAIRYCRVSLYFCQRKPPICRVSASICRVSLHFLSIKGCMRAAIVLRMNTRDPDHIVEYLPCVKLGETLTPIIKIETWRHPVRRDRSASAASVTIAVHRGKFRPRETAPHGRTLPVPWRVQQIVSIERSNTTQSMDHSTKSNYTREPSIPNRFKRRTTYA